MHRIAQICTYIFQNFPSETDPHIWEAASPFPMSLLHPRRSFIVPLFHSFRGLYVTRLSGLEVAATDHKIGQCIQRSALFPGRADGWIHGSEPFAGGAKRRGGRLGIFKKSL